MDELQQFLEDFRMFAPQCGQLLDGWHCDVAWTEWDTEVRQKLTSLHLRVEPLLAARNTRAQPADGEAWRPIETAPKDGTEVLLWATPYSMLNPNSVRIVGHYDRGWWDNTSCVLSHVTAWQPLPAPPRTQAQKPAEEKNGEAKRN